MGTRKKNIVLFGFMGTGKTCIGRAIAGRLSMEYVDLDDLIEAREGRSITDIFATKGEPYFRQIEAETVVEAARLEGYVIATGGGVVLQEANVRALEATGVGICLVATAEAIYERVRRGAHRPLLAVDDPMGQIRILLEARAPFYAQVAHQIDTIGRSVDAVASEVITIWQRESE